MKDLYNQESPERMKKGLIHFGARYLKIDWMKSDRMLFHNVYPFMFRIPEIGSITPLISASRQLAPAAERLARQGVQRLSGCQPFHNRHQSGPVNRDRRAGLYRWETRRWRRFHGVLASAPVSTQAAQNDTGSSVDAPSRAPSRLPSNTDDVHRCVTSLLHSHRGK